MLALLFSFLLVMLARSQVPPHVHTQPANNIHIDGATLNGMAVANGLSTVAWFEWGPLGSYGQKTSVSVINSEFAVVRLSAGVDSLLPGNNYQCRLVASNAAGIKFGAVKLFNTGKHLVSWGRNDMGQIEIPVGCSNVVSAACGNGHTLVLRTDGTVSVFGDGSRGRTNLPSGLSNVLAVAAGSYHCLALLVDGSVMAWGDNQYGQTTIPNGLSNVIALAAGYGHSLALKKDGTVVAWGLNDLGQTNVSAGLSNVVAIAASSDISLALKADGTIEAWGNSRYKQTIGAYGLSNIVAIAAGTAHCLALRENSSVVAWGDDPYHNFGQTSVPPGLSNVVAIDSGDWNNLALRSDGSVLAWGNNWYGQNNTPVGLNRVVDVASGYGFNLIVCDNNAPTVAPQEWTGPANHDLVLDLHASDLNKDAVGFKITSLPDRGKLYQYNDAMRGGLIANKGTRVDDFGGRVVFVPASNDFGVPYTSFSFVANDGEASSFAVTGKIQILNIPEAFTQGPIDIRPASAVYSGLAIANGFATTAWFEFGQYGQAFQETPKKLVGDGGERIQIQIGVSNLISGTTYLCRLVTSNVNAVVYGAWKPFTTGKRVLAFGNNDAGQCNVPGELNDVVAVSAGYFHSMALRADGTVTAWGSNTYGQTNIPTGLSNIVAIACGASNNLAIRLDGSWVRWGYTDYFLDATPPTLTNVIAGAIGKSHIIMIRADGTVASWGMDTIGRVSVPQGLSSIVAVAAGRDHSIALRKDGTVIGWGGIDGQANVPMGLSNVVAISAGLYHNLAVKADGSVVSWGETNDNKTLVPAGVSEASAGAGGSRHSLVLCANVRPQVSNYSVTANANEEAVITLRTFDSNHDVLQWRISTLPTQGSLFQYVNGHRTEPILHPETVVSDTNGRVIFVPVTNTFGTSYATFSYGVNDGYTDSASAIVTVHAQAGNARAYTHRAHLLRGDAVKLNGMIWPNYLATTAWFEWGERGEYGHQTEAVTLGGNGIVQHLTATLANLNLNQTYQCRLVASNVSGITYGPQQLMPVPGKLIAWGNNYYGQTSVPANLGKVQAIAAGNGYTLALRLDGTVAAWGQNNVGPINIPPGLTNVVEITARADSCFALCADSTLTIWGSTNAVSTNTPVNLNNIVSIAAGSSHALALLSNGKIVAWGNNESKQLNLPTDLSNVVAIACGADFSFALRGDGKIFASGPMRYEETNVPAALTNVITLAAGTWHAVALSSGGTVAAWGNPSYETTAVPAELRNVASIAVGEYHNLAACTDGSVVAWGQNFYGQTTVPLKLGRVTAIMCGSGHSGVLTDNYVPQTQTQVVSGPANSDLVIRLGAVDLDGDTLHCRISVLPASGTLYQYSPEFGRGSEISGTNQFISDSEFRVVFAASTNGAGNPYATFYYVVNDDQVDSLPGAVTVNIIGAPIAFTKYPAEIRSTTAVLSGLTMANHVESIAWFEYGLLGSYGQLTPPVSIGSELNWVAVKAAIDNLQPGLAYQYRLVVSNVAGLHQALPRMFYTGKKPFAFGGNGYGQTNIPPNLTNIVKVAAGTGHCLALATDGTVTAWGNNSDGQTNVPAGLSNVVSMAAGTRYSLALKSDGRLTGWGYFPPNQTNIIDQLDQVVEIACGATHCMALRSDGTVAAWGDNTYGKTNVPAGLNDGLAIATGANHSIILRKNGTVVVLGDDFSGMINQSGRLSNIADVALGDYHGLACKADGITIAWGYGFDRQTAVPGSATNVVAMAAGATHSFGLQADGKLLAWGYGTNYFNNIYTGLSNVAWLASGSDYGIVIQDNQRPTVFSQEVSAVANQDLVIQLGGGDPDGDKVLFKIVELPTSGSLYQCIAGFRGNLISSAGSFITDNSNRVIYAPDADGYGTLWDTFKFLANDGSADSTNAIVTINISGKTRCFALAPSHIRLNKANFNGVTALNGLPSKAWFEWGVSGQFDRQTVAAPITPGQTYVRITMPADNLPPNTALQCRMVVSNATGTCYSMPRQFSTGKPVVAWGTNTFGQLGIPTNLSNAVAIAAGTSHFVASDATGNVVAWGNNTDGQTNVPPGLSNVTAVAAGTRFSLALRDDGRVSAWGYLDALQSNIVSQLDQVVAIACGQEHCLALRSNGTVVAWGNNNYNQTNVPATLTNAAAVFAGAAQSFALTSDGQVYGWGRTNSGEALIPAGLTGVVDIAAGDYHTLALNMDGLVTAWGFNTYNRATVPSGLSNVVSVAAGWISSFATRSDGSLVAWGRDDAGLLSTAQSISNVAGMVCANLNCAAIRANSLPQAFSQTVSGFPNMDLLIQLTGTEGNNGAIGFKIVTLPNFGGLYQYQNGGRGDPIFNFNTTVTDPAGYVIFAPAASSTGSLCDSFLFNAFDTASSSPTASVTIKIAGTARAFTDRPGYIGSDSAILRGIANPDGLPSLVWFKYGEVNYEEMTTPPQQIDAGMLYKQVKAALSSLTPFKRYQYQMVISNACGIGYGIKQLFTTGGSLIGWGAITQATIPRELTNVVSVTAGNTFALALKADGRLTGWGDNTYKQSTIPSGLSNVIGFAAGKGHSLVIKPDGTVLAWGFNNYNQTNVPPTLSGVAKVAAGQYFSMALKDDGTIVIWGKYPTTITNIPAEATNIVSIAAGIDHCLALRTDGKLFGWGSSGSWINIPANASNVVEIAAGQSRSIALQSNGKVLAWGNLSTVPATVSNIVNIDMGDLYAVALRSNGMVYAWGDNRYGQTNLPNLSRVVSIAAGGGFGLALVVDALPRFTRTETGGMFPLGGSLQLNLGPVGLEPLYYKWFFNNTNLIDGGTNSTLSLTNLQLNQAGTYTLMVTNLLGAITSAPIVISVPYYSPSPAFSFFFAHTAFQIQAEPQRAYWLETKDNLNDPWLVVDGVTNASGLMTLRHFISTNTSHFYRLGSAPTP